MASAIKWYVKNADGRVFGPVEEDTLLAWAQDGRIEPFAGLSNDLKNWTLASLKPELGMDWIVENEPGRFYGPTTRAVVDDLRKSGALSNGSRIYRDDKNGASARAEAEKDARIETLQAESEKNAAELAELRQNLARKDRETETFKSSANDKEAELNALRDKMGKREAELNTLRNAVQRKDSELDTLRTAAGKREAELKQLQSQATAREADLAAVREENAKLKASLEKLMETHQREWKTEVVTPEVVLSEAPPVTARNSFTNGMPKSLADLERQAQAELARMGATGARRFFGFGRK